MTKLSALLSRVGICGATQGRTICTASASGLVSGSLVVAITGLSGAGKTSLAEALAEHYRKHGGASVIRLDSYYRGRKPEQDRSEFLKQNFDHPAALDLALFASHLNALKQGIPIKAPEVDYKGGTFFRQLEVELIKPSPLIIAEGTLLHHSPELRSLYDLSVFVSAPSFIAASRRIRRDATDRHLSMEYTLSAYEKAVYPMYRQYIKPYKVTCDLVLSSYPEKNADGSDVLAHNLKRIVEHLESRFIPEQTVMKCVR